MQKFLQTLFMLVMLPVFVLGVIAKLVKEAFHAGLVCGADLFIRLFNTGE